MAATVPVAPAGTAGASQVSSASSRYTAPLAVLTTLFFMWGFLTCLNDIIIPHLKAVFSLNYAQAMLVQFAFFTAYFVMSLPSGRIVTRFGYKNGIIIGSTEKRACEKLRAIVLSERLHRLTRELTDQEKTTIDLAECCRLAKVRDLVQPILLSFGAPAPSAHS